MTDAKVMPKLIAEQHELLPALHGGQPKLCFVRSIISDGLKLILCEKFESWGMSDSDKKDWVKTTTRRISNICRPVCQSDQKPSPPS